MLSVILLIDPVAAGDASATVRDVAKTLAGLVDLVVSDIVADAFVVSPPGIDFDRVEQSAGCTIVAEDSIRVGLGRALAGARRRHALLLTPGYAPDFTFADETYRAINDQPDVARGLHAVSQSWVTRLVSLRSPIVGLVASREALTSALSRDRGIPALARTLKARPLRARADRL